MRQMGKLLTEQPSERVVPIAGAREEVLDALRRGNEELRPAALAAQRLRVLVAGRLPGQIAEQLMAALDWRLTMDKDTVVWTDEPHLRMLVAIAAAEDDDSASAGFSRISRLFAVESPALRGRGRDLAPAVRRRPDEVRAILVTLAGQGSQHAAEMLAGWNLTGEAGRSITRPAAEQSAWDAAAPFAEQAAGRLAAPPEGTPGQAPMIGSFPGDAGLVTILDPADESRRSPVCSVSRPTACIWR